MFVNYYDIKSESFANNIDYESLQKNCNFEDITNGRKGAIIVRPMNGTIPVVRSTTKYKLPVTCFSAYHDDLVKEIQKTTSIEGIDFNNAMIEIYDNNYKSMGYHSDLSLDLLDNSCVCIFSCYKNKEHTLNVRKLVLRDKEQFDKESCIKMNHNSLIVFNTRFNEYFQHKIVLHENFKNDDEWLGITFRFSKTYVKFVNEIPYFLSGEEFVIANLDNTKEFYTFRSCENKTKGFKYPKINYTISMSDLYNIGSL